MTDVRLTVGFIIGGHGTDGELAVRLATDDPDQLLRIKRVFFNDDANTKRVLAVRFHAGLALIRIAGIGDRDAAEALRGTALRISGKDARPLAEGEFYLYQVIGLSVSTERGEPVGRVVDLIETGANDVFVIRPDEGGDDVLIPNHPDTVLELDPKTRRMVIRPLVYYGS